MDEELQLVWGFFWSDKTNMGGTYTRILKARAVLGLVCVCLVFGGFLLISRSLNGRALADDSDGATNKRIVETGKALPVDFMLQSTSIVDDLLFHHCKLDLLAGQDLVRKGLVMIVGVDDGSDVLDSAKLGFTTIGVEPNPNPAFAARLSLEGKDVRKRVGDILWIFSKKIDKKKKKIIMHRMAASQESGKMIELEWQGRKSSAPTIRLEDLVPDPKSEVTLLQLDVNGPEYGALLGFERLLERVSTLFIEITNVHQQAGLKIVEILLNKGCTVFPTCWVGFEEGGPLWQPESPRFCYGSDDDTDFLKHLMTMQKYFDTHKQMQWAQLDLVVLCSGSVSERREKVKLWAADCARKLPDFHLEKMHSKWKALINK